MTAALLALAAASAGSPDAAPAQLSDYDVVWTSPSKDAAGSMPIGNGEVVLNVWVEESTGDLLFYIARTDSLSEISRILKLGGVRVHLDPCWRRAGDFRQRLDLRNGRIDVSGGGGRLSVMVDSAAHVVHLAGSFGAPLRATVSAICWRNEPRPLPPAENGSAWSVHDAPFPRIESADVFLTDRADAVVWYHRNETSVVPKLWENQSLTGWPGAFDPIIHRTFGCSIEGTGMARSGERELASSSPTRSLRVRIATHTAQTPTVGGWRAGLESEALRSVAAAAERRTKAWWNAYWQRSWVFVAGDSGDGAIPSNRHPMRKGSDSNGQNRFEGTVERWACVGRVLSPQEMADHFSGPSADGPPGAADVRLEAGMTLMATIQPSAKQPGRIFDKVTAGGADGFLFDTHPGDSLRLIVGSVTLTAPGCLTIGTKHNVAATYDAGSGEACIYLDGRQVAHRAPEKGSAVTRGYILQRYVQACQSRGTYPVKFNGGHYTVEPAAVGMPHNADFRNWGDCHWFQNVRHMYHPMPASGDTDMMDAFFRLYETVRPLAESRTKLYHEAQGAYFPETMTAWGTYSGGDYGWDRTGREPSYVQCRYWAYAWNQGPELLGLLLDRWDYTRDAAFLKQFVLPMAESVLRYFDTRFAKDAAGRIVLDPTQVVETYWDGVVNDLPTTAGLISVTDRLCALPEASVPAAKRAFFARMRKACPELPLETEDGARELAPAQRYDPRTSNCENGELYAVWPFRVVSLARPALLEEARRAYAHRKNRLDVGWGYDGNAAALLGMAEEAGRIIRAKARNSHPAYRWPATWGPNFDWLPDQNHGGNLLNQTHLMLLQAEPLEAGGAIRVLPAWPKEWDVRFKLHAPGNTVVQCTYARGRVVDLDVSPPSRAKDVVLPK